MAPSLSSLAHSAPPPSHSLSTLRCLFPTPLSSHAARWQVDLGGGTQAAPKFASVPDNGGVVSMPSAPTSAMSEEEKELAELEQLQSSMGAM